MITKENLEVILFRALAGGADISAVLDLARKAAFDNPIILVNASSRVLAMSSGGPVENSRAWTEAAKTGTLVETAGVYRGELDSLQFFQNRTPFLYTSGYARDMPRILAPIDFNRETLGYILIISITRPLSEEDLGPAGVLCDALRILLSKDGSEGAQKLGIMEYSLKQLLDGEEIKPEIFAFPGKPLYTAVSISLPSEAKKQQFVPFLKEKLCAGTNFCFVYRHALFLLICQIDSAGAPPVYPDLPALIREYGLSAGISNSFNSLAMLKLYYGQAEKIRSLGLRLNPETRIYYYSDMILYLLIARSDPWDLEGMISPEYRALVLYDQVHGSDLLPTLVAWHDNMLNISETAAVLHLHRNTVAYRLDMIREKVGINISRMQVLVNIVLSDRITKWLIG